MSVEEQFNLIAREYDDSRRRFIPCFEDYYRSTTDFIAANIRIPDKIIDLGAGTGILTCYWYEAFPQSEFLLVDIADEMLEVAKKRFAGLDNVSYLSADYTGILPGNKADAVISALSIHHLEDADKESLFAAVYDSLSDGGIFVNYDQFSAGSGCMNRWFDSYWENGLSQRGLTEHDIALWKERRKLDRECSVEEEMSMMRRSGFREVKCVYTYQKFSVILCMK